MSAEIQTIIEEQKKTQSTSLRIHEFKSNEDVKVFSEELKVNESLQKLDLSCKYLKSLKNKSNKNWNVL